MLAAYGLYFVTPPGFEPRSSEPESDILSIELWGRFTVGKNNKIPLVSIIILIFHPNPYIRRNNVNCSNKTSAIPVIHFYNLET